MQKHSVMPTFIRETYGFGISTKDGKQVYLPASIIESGAKPGQAIELMVAENKNDQKNNTPWFAICLAFDIEEEQEHTDEPTPQEEPALPDYMDDDLPLTERASMAIAEMSPQTPVFTTGQLADFMKMNTTKKLSQALVTLFEWGELYRLDIRAGSTKRSSATMWSAERERLMEMIRG